jgi:hypothetical protein
MQREVDAIECAHVDLTHTVDLVHACTGEDRGDLTRGHRYFHRKARAVLHGATGSLRFAARRMGVATSLDSERVDARKPCVRGCRS